MNDMNAMIRRISATISVLIRALISAMIRRISALISALIRAMISAMHLSIII